MTTEERDNMMIGTDKEVRIKVEQSSVFLPRKSENFVNYLLVGSPSGSKVTVTC